MKEKLDSESRAAIVKYRLERAYETLKEADYTAESWASMQMELQEAKDEFKPYAGTTQRGYSYTGYEYDGQKYHDVTYLGEFEDDELPHNDIELMDILIKCQQKNK